MPSLEDIKGKVFEFGGNGYAQGNSSKSNSKTTDGGRDDETKDNELWKISLKEHDLSFARGTICSKAEHDRTSIDQIFLGMMSAATNKPIGHTVNSRKAGVGKSYLLNKVASYFPYKYVRISSRSF